MAVICVMPTKQFFPSRRFSFPNDASLGFTQLFQTFTKVELEPSGPSPTLLYCHIVFLYGQKNTA
jgi:hypothetical protein